MYQQKNTIRLNANPKNHRGLTSSQAKEKLRIDGFNSLPASKVRNYFSIVWDVVKEPMFILLVACGSLYLVLGDVREGIMLLCFVFIIMGIEFIQKKKTEKALDALKELASPKALVIRDGEEHRIASRDVVVEDIIVLQEGDRVPADAVILQSTNLLADESLLTGEPVPVRKVEWDEKLKCEHPGGDDLPFVFSGSMIVHGNGIAQVTAIGLQTEIGKISNALDDIKELPTRFSKEMSSLVKKITVISIIVSLLLVIAYFITRGNLINGFLAGLTLAMSILPEEFPVILTVFMAIGAWRMSKKKVLTREASAIETLGSTTVLCADKTGTLTQNKMVVSMLYNGIDFLRLEKSSTIEAPFTEVAEFSMLASQRNPFDPMEKAIKNMSSNFEHIYSGRAMIKEYPLSKELLAMSRVYSYSDNNMHIIATKGAPEAIFDLCHLDESVRKQYLIVVEEFASKGLRVIGVAKAKIEDGALPKKQHDFKFDFVGLIGLSDPIKQNVKQAVAECYTAGIRVIMITGDYPITAIQIAKQIGLKNAQVCITGRDIAKMTDVELRDKIRDVNVFARIIPEQKLKIVIALKQNNEIVAMTGDGINDSPALKAADIGISMGERGTDVAREASSLVLLDDDFSSIVGAIKMGRRIFDNLQKAFSYTFAIHVPIAGLSLIPVLIGNYPLILWPVHIVFLELIIDPACSIIFEAEKAEENIMRRPPKRIGEPFFSGKMILFSCLQGFGILIITLSVYLMGLHLGYNIKEVRTMAFITLIVSNIAIIISNRSKTDSIYKILITPNKAMLWIVGSAILFLTLILNISFLLELFMFQSITLVNIGFCVLAGIFSIAWIEIYKYTRKNKL